MTIQEKQEEVISEFSMFDDWMDKYAYLIDLGKDMPLIDEKFKTKQYLISGCQSRVWLHAEMQDGKMILSADSDAVITKGIASLLIRVLSGQSPEDILKSEIIFPEKIGLKDHLSPTRANGLQSMIKQVKLYAQAFVLKSLKK
jgi:cysteine desulfuration protein SufE